MMTVFKLERFPYVCRLCLKADPPGEMLSLLDCCDPAFEGNAADFIAAVTFIMSEDKFGLLPQKICHQCTESLKSFAKYRSKIMNIHLLMNSLVELKRSNSIPIVDLFQNKNETITTLLKELDLCNKKEVTIQDLINEFPLYEIASIPDASQEKAEASDENQTLLDQLDFDPDIFLNEEFIPHTLPDLSTQLLFKEETILPETETILPESFQTVLEDMSKVDDYAIDPASDEGGTKSKITKDRFKCTKCKYSTYYERNFQSHQQRHRKIDVRRFHCTEPGCSEGYSDYADYRHHCVSVHDLFICETCGLRCSTQTTLDLHRERHLLDKRYTCHYCKKEFKNKSDVGTHIRAWHDADINFSCETCGLVFKRKDIRDIHQRTHKNEYNFPCNLCDKKFKDAAGLRRHRAQVHDKVRHSCEHCGYAGTTLSKLKDHIEGIHGIQTRFICNICVLSTDSQEKLEVHKSRHSSPNELECAICLVLHKSTEGLANHLCITYRDDYVCCNRDFKTHYQYNKHMLTKHGTRTNVRVKPVPGVLLGQLRAGRKRVARCPNCETVFPNRTQKLKHMKICSNS